MRFVGSPSLRCVAVSYIHGELACARFICMRSIVRLLLLCLLIVALPLRGIAAEIALPCTMAHTSAASSATERTGVSGHPGTVWSAHSGAQEHGDTPAVHPAKPSDKGVHSGHSSCRVCCVCHVGVSAPPPSATSGPLTAHFVKDRIFPISSFTGWIPPRIERPPRV